MRLRITFVTVLCLVTSGLSVAFHPVLRSAESIVEDSGVRGGLVVHVGCGDGSRTVKLRLDESYLVHGLDKNAGNVQRARVRIRNAGLYGKVSVDRLATDRLPYIDNLVNLIVAESSSDIPLDELLRVLVPNGIAYVRKKGRWTKTVKTRSDDIDEWTHFLYNASGNAVSNDEKVAPPRHIQWQAGPKRSRDHDSLASMSAMTSSNGRLFYIYDEGPTSLVYHPAKWRLIARDAFNGVPLWKRDIDSWVTHLYYFRTGPVQLPRRLVSVSDRVYATLGLDAPVTALDAATGETRLTYKGSDNTEEFIYHNDILLTVIGGPHLWNRHAPDIYGYWELSVDKEPEISKSIVAYQAITGKVLWTRSSENLNSLVPLSLSAHGDKAFYMDSDNIYCLDVNTGQELWHTECPTDGLFLRSYAPTVAIYDDVLLCLTTKHLAGYSIEDGRQLWKHKGYLGFASPGDLFAIDGLAWTIPQTSGIMSGRKLDKNGKIVNGIRISSQKFLGNGNELRGINIHTGEITKSFAKKDTLPGGHHHRCYRNKATANFLICGRRGVEFVDLNNQHHVNNWWIRGECQYGIMPANGLLYIPPDPCRCFNFIKFNGLNALSAGNSLDDDPSDGPRLITGPAYGTLRVGESTRNEWPTYRHDTSRTGSATTSLSPNLNKVWETRVDGQPSAVVIADNRLYASVIDQHAVVCLDAETGTFLWRFTAGGRVDSPPTIIGDIAVFGCRDGWVYAVGASDGSLAWRFRAAPIDQRTVVEGDIESVWPVHGSVLAQDNVVYLAAGRSSYLDEGIHVYGLDAVSGTVLHETTVTATPNVPGQNTRSHDNVGVLPDILVAAGDRINMRQVQFDRSLNQQRVAELSTILTSTGFLEDIWFHRQSWTLGPQKEIDSSTHAGAIRPKGSDAMGKLIVYDEDSVYGVRIPYSFLKHTPSQHPPGQSGHKHQKYSRYAPEHFPIGVDILARAHMTNSDDASARRRKASPPRESNSGWQVSSPMQVRAMVLCQEHLLLSGWMDSYKLDDPTDKVDESKLMILSRKDGHRINEYKLDAKPVFDGMAAANEKLYIPLKNGSLVCMK